MHRIEFRTQSAWRCHHTAYNPWMVDVLACHKLTQKLKCQWSHQHIGPFVPLAHAHTSLSLSYSFNIKKHSEFRMLMELLNGTLYWFCVHRCTLNAELSVINRTEFEILVLFFVGCLSDALDREPCETDDCMTLRQYWCTRTANAWVILRRHIVSCSPAAAPATIK